MKHEEIYHTCDRCGKRIDKTPIDVAYLKRLWRKTCNSAEYKILAAEKRGFIVDSKLISEDVISVIISEEYKLKENKIDLCGDCQKAFERFMRNEET